MVMLILLVGHIIVALSGIAIAVVSLVSMSRRAISASYMLTGATIATGTGLVILKPDSLLKSCLTGLLYMVVILVLTSLAQYRLATNQSK